MNELDRVAESIRRDIEASIAAVGVLVRVFGRGKSERSIARKRDKDPGKYSVGGRLIQDSVGIRVVLYFGDDAPVVEEILKQQFEFLPAASSIDQIDEHTFNVVRRNLVFRLPDESSVVIARMVRAGIPVDATFEIQIRTVLSEGWHEVEHDLRYKCRSAWEGHSDLNRALNGVIATLETSEWSMLKIFDDLAHRHYKSRSWAAMCHAKLRVRAEPAMGEELCRVFDADSTVPKGFYRSSRRVLLSTVVRNRLHFPVSVDNMVYLWNWIGPRHEMVLACMPAPIVDVYEEIPLS